MTVTLTAHQLRSLELTERIASCLSLAGTMFVMVTFLYSPAFRKPINRLIFYATWGNTICNAATLMSQSGMRAGKNSPLCQIQGFLIQMSIPADALWNLALAINVYLTLFRNYKPQQLKALEWKYHIMCNGMPFIVALTYAFIETKSRGKIYGPASLWCWVSVEWIGLRVALCYAPAWICIIISFTIYAMAGRRIYLKRLELRSVSLGNRYILDGENPVTGFKTTEVQITREPAPVCATISTDMHANQDAEIEAASRGYHQYTVTIDSNPLPRSMSRPMSRPMSKPMSRPALSTNPSGDTLLYRQHSVALEANTAAWGYTKIALLFFISLLVTWVPSSVNRVYSLIYPGHVSVPFTYASSVVLPLMGFWNSLIYITTSWKACKLLFMNMREAIFPRPQQDSSLENGVERGRALTTNKSPYQLTINTQKNEHSTSSTDSMRTLARGYGMSSA